MFNPNAQPIYFMTTAIIRMAISAGGSVAIGIGGNTPEGKFHVLQNQRLGAAKNSFTLLQSLGQEGGSTGTNVLHVRDFSRRSESTEDNWYTWNHHNSIDIDAQHNVPGVNTKTWWERSPYSGSHAFGNMTTTTLKVISGMYDAEGKSKVLVGQGDETKHPNATLSVLHPTNPSIINVGHPDVAGPHKVVINGGGVNIDYGYHLTGSGTVDVFFKTRTDTSSVGQLGSNGTTVATIDGPNNVFTITGKLAATPAAKPALPTSTGIAGEIRIDPTPIAGIYYIYVCVATNTWRRVALTAFT
jgi:hypothetical protein